MNLPRLLFRLLLGRRLPTTSGTQTIAGPGARVEIRRDSWGIPYIEAGSDHDAWFALGFCHGQDRAFQLELLLRVVRGSLAELVGPDLLPVDRLSRRVGFRHAALQQLPVIAEDVRVTLDAYAAGVTAGATAGGPRWAHEFALLRRAPTPWTAADVLGMLKLQSFLLAANWDVEMARLAILTADGPEALAALDPGVAAWMPVSSPPGAPAGPALDRLAEDLAAFAAVTRIGGGSNSWALGPSRTATGRPLLANDPHLSPGLPPHWYLAHLWTPQWAAAGATFVGIPAVTVGHNGFCAWGVTAGLADNTDLFRERLGPDGRSVHEGDALVPCDVRSETIAVRGGGPATVEVLTTQRGPIIGPAPEGSAEALSLRATWLDADPVRGLFALHRVRSFEEFRAALSEWPAGTMSLAYADITGAVAWQLAGTVPRRRRGWGLLPLAGWEAENGWHDDPIPFDEMPYLYCGPSSSGNGRPGPDFVSTANNQPLPQGEGPFLGADWMDGYRQARIVEVLSGRHDWDVAATMALQMDRTSRAWGEVRHAILAVPAESDAARRGLELLREWDGVLGDDSAAGTVYELFMTGMMQRVARGKAPRGYEWALGKSPAALMRLNFLGHRRTAHLARLLREQPPGWLPRPWPEEMADALAAAVTLLQKRYGNDASCWGWGRLRPVVLRHPLGRRKGLGHVFDLGPVPCGGDNDTVAQASVLPLDPLAPTDNTPSLRVVIDVGAWGNSRFVLPGGQSGNPLSPHYADQLPLWRRGEGVPMAWSPEEVRAAARQTLVLLPGERPA